MMKLEVACFNLESAIIAADAGADRIEFCENYDLGGITPKIDEFKILRAYTTLPIYVMIRPRGGNFVYSESEINTMISSVKEFINLGVDGFVLGCLTQDNTIDIESNRKLIDAAGHLTCTFHRAFDRLEDWQSGLTQIINLGFKSILTSGGKSNAFDGLEQLNQLQILAKGKIELICGGGIRSSNIDTIKNQFQTSFYHSSCLTDHGTIANPIEIKQLKLLLSQ